MLSSLFKPWEYFQNLHNFRTIQYFIKKNKWRHRFTTNTFLRFSVCCPEETLMRQNVIKNARVDSNSIFKEKETSRIKYYLLFKLIHSFVIFLENILLCILHYTQLLQHASETSCEKQVLVIDFNNIFLSTSLSFMGLIKKTFFSLSIVYNINK